MGKREKQAYLEAIAIAITRPNVLTRARFWTNSVRYAAISANTLSGF